MPLTILHHTAWQLPPYVQYVHVHVHYLVLGCCLCSWTGACNNRDLVWGEGYIKFLCVLVKLSTMGAGVIKVLRTDYRGKGRQGKSLGV